MSDHRIAELQGMFDEIGLGRVEDRARLAALGLEGADAAGVSEEPSKEQIFVRLESNTSYAAESRHG